MGTYRLQHTALDQFAEAAWPLNGRGSSLVSQRTLGSGLAAQHYGKAIGRSALSAPASQLDRLTLLVAAWPLTDLGSGLAASCVVALVHSRQRLGRFSEFCAAARRLSCPFAAGVTVVFPDEKGSEGRNAETDSAGQVFSFDLLQAATPLQWAQLVPIRQFRGALVAHTFRFRTFVA